MASHPRYTPQPLPQVAALYVRVSSKKQGEDGKASLPTQEDGCRRLALADGFPIAPSDVFIDKHTGEELHERPALTALREAAKTRRFARLYVHSVDRLSRDPIHLGIVLDEMARLGIEVQFVTEPLDDSPEAGIIRYIQGYAGKIENARRRERSMRTRTARAAGGKPIPGPRPPYGFRWTDERDHEGRRLRIRWEHDPLTESVVAGIWRQALGSLTWTVRGIAARLTREGIPTPTGRREWDPTTVRQILTTSVYWGQPRALQHEQVPVAPDQRQYYAHKTRAVRRDPDGVLALPPDVAPGFVTPEQAAEVQRRLTVHQRQAPRGSGHTHDALLRGGIAKCGYCGYSLYVANVSASRHAIAYRCRKLAVRAHGCGAHSIAVQKLDAAVWAKVCEVFGTPSLIEQEVAHMRELDAKGEAPGAGVLADLEQRIATTTRRIENKRRYAELVDDPDEQAEVAGEVKGLLKVRADLEAERADTARHFADWQRDQAGLQQTLDWCARVAGNLATFTFEERRDTLLTLKADVRLYRSDRTPRAELTISLPLSGAQALELGGLASGHSDGKFLVCSSQCLPVHLALDVA